MKEELLVSLNRKKPDIVEHLNIEYFKIVERVKTVGPLRVVAGLCRASGCIRVRYIGVCSISCWISREKSQCR